MNVFQLIGLIAGDGHIEKNGTIVISTSSEEFAKIIIKSLSKLDSKPIIFWDKGGNVWRIKTRSKILLKKLQEFEINSGRKFDKFSFEKIVKLNKKEKLSVIGGFFDAEGWFEFDKGSPRIRLKIKNEKVVDQIINVLRSIGINARKFKNKNNAFGINVQGRKNVLIFLQEVPLAHPKWEIFKSTLSGGSPESPGPHARHNGRYKGMPPRKGEQIP